MCPDMRSDPTNGIIPLSHRSGKAIGVVADTVKCADYMVSANAWLPAVLLLCFRLIESDAAEIVKLRDQGHDRVGLQVTLFHMHNIFRT